MEYLKKLKWVYFINVVIYVVVEYLVGIHLSLYLKKRGGSYDVMCVYVY